DHRIVKRGQLVKLHIAPHLDITEETYAISGERSIEDACDRFSALMIGRYTVANQAKRDGQAFDDVDRGIGQQPQETVCEIASRGPASDDGNVFHEKKLFAIGRMAVLVAIDLATRFNIPALSCVV